MALLKNRLRSYIYHYGLKAGLPFAAVQGMVNLCEKLPHLRDHLVRRRLGRRIAATSVWRDFLSRDRGVRTFASGEVPGLNLMVRIARELYESHRGRLEGQVPHGSNPFYTLLDADDFRAHPELVEIATSGPLAKSAAAYFGVVPRLENIDLWVTRPNIHEDGLYNSQLFHLDKVGDGYFSIFVNVFEVTAENGPVTVLPADKSAVVRRATNYERRSVFGNGRISDEELLASCRREDIIELCGPAGSGAMVDTSRCFHYGSRCRAGERVILVLSYVPAYRFKSHHVQKFVVRPANNTWLTDLLLAGSPAGNH